MTYQAEISTNHLQTLYQVMLKRIGKGYSAERLSYLIGRKYDYVELVESLQLPIYAASELVRIAMALEEKDHRSFYAPLNDETVLNIITEKHQNKNHVTNYYSKFNEDGQESLLFMLMEDHFGDLDLAPNNADNLQLAKDAIDVMVRGGFFFKAKMPFEILHAVNQLMPVPLDAFYIEIAMGSFCESDLHEGLLRECKSATEGFRYEES